MAGARRRAVFELTDTAHAGIDALATRHRVTKVALIEALGVLGVDHDPTIAEVVAYAHELDRERRNRQKDR